MPSCAVLLASLLCFGGPLVQTPGPSRQGAGQVVAQKRAKDPKRDENSKEKDNAGETPKKRGREENQGKKAKPASKAKQAKPASKTKPAKPASKKPLDRLVFTVLPVLNYTTDRGLGFGVYSVIARFKEGYDPYVWRIYFRLSATVRRNDEGAFEFPFHQDFVRADMPGLLDGKLRLNLRAGFFRFITTGYYGIGNNSMRDPSLPNRFYQFDRIYPEGVVNTRIELAKFRKASLELFLGGTFLYNVTNIHESSRLEKDLRAAQGAATEEARYLRDTLRGIREHALFKFNAGLVWDSRDNEFAPSKGVFHEASVRGGTGFSPALSFVGVNANVRFFFSLWRDIFVLALRGIFDVLAGNVPFYELYSYGGLFPEEGPGGGTSVRGTRPQRYYGKIKLIGNIELRMRLIPIRLLGRDINLGLVLFADAGRVWGDISYPSDALRSQLDGEGVGIKVGLGGGGRLQLGSTVVLRADVAYSPTDKNLSLFFILGHLF